MYIAAILNGYVEARHKLVASNAGLGFTAHQVPKERTAANNRIAEI